MQSLQGLIWRGRAVGVVVGVLTLGGAPALADTIHVATCGDDGWSGASPECQPPDGPKATIQAAIDEAVDEAEIAVLPGTYNEVVDLLGKAVRLYSTDGREVTTIDAGGEPGAGSVVACESGEGPETVLEGFTITGGRAPTGGGMYNSGSSPTVNNCSFTENKALYMAGCGGGMVNWGGSPTVANCTFIDNTADGGGGGMYDGGSTTVMNCTFIGNTADRGTAGGGMYNGGSATVTNCTFTGNTAGGGGGLAAIWNSSPTVANCTFTGNTADRGGGMTASDSSPTVANCAFIGNTAEEYGGGMAASRGSNPTVANCTFIANSAENGRTIACDFGPSDVDLANCILWNGGDEVWNDDGSPIVITYSVVHGGYEGDGNIDSDPLCDQDGRLQAGSPCIDAGNNFAVALDTVDLDEDGNLGEPLPLDLDGNPRLVDAPREDTGHGCAPIVDMGAYESQEGVIPTPLLVFSYPEGRPQAVNWRGHTSFLVEVLPGDAQPEPGTAALYIDVGKGFVEVPVEDLGGNLYEVNFPWHLPCDIGIHYYLQARTDGNEDATDPSCAPEIAFPAVTVCEALLEFDYPEGRPEEIDGRHGGTSFIVEVLPGDADPEPGTSVLFVDTGEGFVELPMEILGDNRYRAIFPTAPCGAEVSYYVRAETTDDEDGTDPPDAPETTFTATSVCAPLLLFTYPEGQPREINGYAGDKPFLVQVRPGDADPEADTGILHVDMGEGFVEHPMEHLGDHLYRAVIPDPPCDVEVLYYVSAWTINDEESTDPPNAPETTFVAPSICACPDVIRDHQVNFLDLLGLLEVWGPCPPDGICEKADFNDDGDVGFQDLVILLSRWGPCE